LYGSTTWRSLSTCSTSEISATIGSFTAASFAMRRPWKIVFIELM
jgi:hypothetical protein